MTRRNPFEELEQFFERMSEQVETGDWSKLTGASVAVDLADTGGAFEIAVDLPGYDRDDIDITLTGDTLQIDAADRSIGTDILDDPDARFVRRERTERTANRSIRLPEPVDEDEASATYDAGVLRIRLAKVDPTENGQQIDID